MMLWVKAARRSCGAVSAPQAVVFCVATITIVALVAMGSPLVLVAPLIAGLVTLILGPPDGPAGSAAALEAA